MAATRARKPKLIAYSGSDEVIICTAAEEEQVLEDYFALGNRDVEDYTRKEIYDRVAIVEVSLKAR